MYELINLKCLGFFFRGSLLGALGLGGFAGRFLLSRGLLSGVFLEPFVVGPDGPGRVLLDAQGLGQIDLQGAPEQLGVVLEKRRQKLNN